MTDDSSARYDDALVNENEEAADLQQPLEEEEAAPKRGGTPDGGAPNPASDADTMTFTPLSIIDSAAEGDNSNLFMDITLPVSIELGRTTMLIKDLLVLTPGAVIELDKLVGEPVDLVVNDKKLAEGEVVVIEENFAVRITAVAGAATGRTKRNRIGR